MNKLFNGSNFRWKTPFKTTTIKNNTQVDNFSCDREKRQNMFSILKDTEEDENVTIANEIL